MPCSFTSSTGKLWTLLPQVSPEAPSTSWVVGLSSQVPHLDDQSATPQPQMPSCLIKAKGRHLGSRGSSSSRRLHWNAACAEQVPPFGKASVSKGQESFMNISLGGLLLLCREHLAGLSRGHPGLCAGSRNRKIWNGKGELGQGELCPPAPKPPGSLPEAGQELRGWIS